MILSGLLRLDASTQLHRDAPRFALPDADPRMVMEVF